MICSDKQYAISCGELTKLKDAVVATEEQVGGEDWVRELEIESLKSQIADLEADISDYDLLKAGGITFAKTHSLDALPSILIQARIAAGMSQTKLAQSLGLKPQQIQRYEATNYMGTSLARLIEVSKILNVHTAGIFEIESKQQGAVFSWDEVDDVVWQEFPAREMAKRRWFDVARGDELPERVKTYFLDVAGPQFVTALHRKRMRGTTVPNEYALLAWQARILERARNRVVHEGLPSFQFDHRWLPELVALTKHPDGPRHARDLLASKGIILVTEQNLPGTYLDGAAMLSATDHPVIGLTLRHDRLDNFWFVLFHELGHVFLHLIDGLRCDFFDDDSLETADRFELEADQFALNALIPEEKWEQCLSRFALSVESVELDAKSLGLDASIIAGRIRREQSNYAILNDLVGHRQVRSQLAEANDDL